MTVETTINRPNLDDIPIRVTVEQEGEHFSCSEEATVTEVYWNNAANAVAYDIGDKIYLTRSEQKQIESECFDAVLDEMSSSQRISYNSYQLRESRGYL